MSGLALSVVWLKRLKNINNRKNMVTKSNYFIDC